MATPEPLTPSRRLRSAALVERARLRRDLGNGERRIARLRQELGAAEDAANKIRRRLALLAEVADDGGEDAEILAGRAIRAVALGTNGAELPAPAPLHGFLSGAAIRIAAVRILVASDSARRPIHHADWYRLLTGAGYGVAGEDPAATFLTQIGRSPVVRRADERGTYALDPDAPTRLRERLGLLHEELGAIHAGQQTLESISTVRERREELVTECGRVERALEEAALSLGSEITGDPFAT